MGTRITDLPVATTVNPADVLPIVQGGNTKQAASSLIKTTNASDLTTGTVAAARLPSATTGAAGIVQLGNTAGTACEGNDARLTNSRAPSGAAGGDLTGTYPNPTLVPLNPSPAGTFGSASTIPVVSVNNKGQVTGVSTVTPAARVSSVDVSGGTTGLSFNNGPITTAGTLLMTGTVNIASGGTGATSAAQARTNLGLPASATVDTTNASNITSGTLNPARLPGLTGDVIAAASSNFTALTTTGVAAGTWGGPSQIPVVTVDAKGRVTTITDVVPSISASNISGGTLASAQLPASGVTPGTIGSSSQIPVLTVDDKGRITAATTAGFPSTGVTPGTYGQNNAIPQIEVDAQGRITNVTNIGVSGSAGGTVTSVGIATSTLSVSNTPITFTGDISVDLPTVLSPATVGSSAAIPVITADAQGRITALATAAIPGLSATGVVAGTYGNGGSVGSFSVNQFGQLTGATSSLIAISSAQITGVLATSQIPAITTSQLPASGVTPGTYGSSTAIPVLTVDALGRLTLASTASPASGGSIYDTVTLVDSGATGTINFDVLSQKNLFYTLPASGNYVVNLRGNGSSTLDSLLSSTQGITLNFASQNGSSARQLSALQIDGISQPVAWNNSTNTIPSTTANSISSWTFNIKKTNVNTYTTLGELNSFGAFGDPYFSNVNLLLHFDGSFADYKNANSFLTTGSPSIDTSIVKFGSGSLLLPAGNNRLTYTPNSGNPFSVNTILNITFEFWIYISSIQQDQDVFFISNDDLNVGYKFKITNNRIPQWTNIAGTQTASGNSAIPLNQWTHIAFRTGYQSTVFWINGVFGAFYEVDSTDGNKLIFYSSSNYQPVYIDDFRCTSNVQRYAYANFTPPLSAYPNF